MGSAKKQIISEKLEDLERALRDYFGALNEVYAGLKAKMPPKPQALSMYESCQALGIPLAAGGVQDQPHIWLQELAIVIQESERFAILRASQEKSAAPN